MGHAASPVLLLLVLAVPQQHQDLFLVVGQDDNDDDNDHDDAAVANSFVSHRLQQDLTLEFVTTTIGITVGRPKMGWATKPTDFRCVFVVVAKKGGPSIIRNRSSISSIHQE
jgi:hypothetical protein